MPGAFPAVRSKIDAKMLLKGIHYRNPKVYNLLTFLKLRNDYNLRFRIASRYVRAKETVLDICAGTGRLMDFLPEGCRYVSLDFSPGFLSILSYKSKFFLNMDLHKGLEMGDFQADSVVMIISLYHFRHTSLHKILEDLKKMGKKVIIIEEVCNKAKRFINFPRFTDYLCAIEKYLPAQLFREEEFRDVALKHGYRYQRYDKRYCLALYPPKMAIS